MTATATSLPPYSTFFESFSVDSVIAKLDDHQDGYLNAFDACCGRHVRQGRGDVLALVHEDTQGQTYTLTYSELDQQSGQLAGWFKSQGYVAHWGRLPAAVYCLWAGRRGLPS